MILLWAKKGTPIKAFHRQFQNYFRIHPSFFLYKYIPWMLSFRHHSNPPYDNSAFWAYFSPLNWSVEHFGWVGNSLDGSTLIWKCWSWGIFCHTKYENCCFVALIVCCQKNKNEEEKIFLQEINIVQQQDMFSQKERHDKIQQTATQRGKTVFSERKIEM